MSLRVALVLALLAGCKADLPKLTDANKSLDVRCTSPNADTLIDVFPTTLANASSVLGAPDALVGVFCETPTYDPLNVSPWIAMSLLQKAIRRGQEHLALRAAATLQTLTISMITRAMKFASSCMSKAFGS